jgi:hypothetical protein
LPRATRFSKRSRPPDDVVGGQQVVRDGKALAFDSAEASVRLQMAQRRAIEKVPGFDWGGRSAAEIMPRPSRRSEHPPASGWSLQLRRPANADLIGGNSGSPIYFDPLFPPGGDISAGEPRAMIIGMQSVALPGAALAGMTPASYIIDVISHTVLNDADLTLGSPPK